MFLTVQAGLSTIITWWFFLNKKTYKEVFFMWITGSTSPALHLSSEERKRFFLGFALPFPLNYHVKWHKHPISAEQLSNSTGVLGEGENVQGGGGLGAAERTADRGIRLRFSEGAYSVGLFLFPIFCSIEACRGFCRSAALIITDHGSCESCTISQGLQHEGQF